jgi:hypothetical protein
MRHRHPGTLWPTTHDEPRAARAAPGYGAPAGDLSVKCLSVSVSCLSAPTSSLERAILPEASKLI